MLPHQIVPLSTFRTDAARYAEWVRRRRGRVWLARHGTLIGGLVSMREINLLETFEGRALSQERRKLQAEYVRWKRLKAAGHLAHEWDWQEMAMDDETLQDFLAEEIAMLRAKSDEGWGRTRRRKVGLPEEEEELTDNEIAELKRRGAWYG